METVALMGKDLSVSRDDGQSSSQATSSINLVHVSNTRLLTHESSTNPTEIVRQTLKRKDICELSVDVLVFVADSLPPDTAALLSISCKTLWRTLGSKYVKALKTPYRVIYPPVSSMYRFNVDIRLYRSYRYNFLRLLARDLPDHITCYPCNKLHTIKPAYLQRLYHKRCALHVDNTLHLLTISASFHWFQIAMKRYRQSRSSDPILFHDEMNIFLSEMSKLVEVSRESIQLSHTLDSMIFRNQRIVFLPARHHYPIFEHSIAGVPRSTSWSHPICPHLSWECFYELHTRRLRVSEIPFRLTIFQSCDYCMTDFHFEIRDHGEEGDALLFTSWMNLGSGESAREYNWQNAIADVDRQGLDTVSPYEYEHGSVCEAYEGIPGRRYKLEYNMAQHNWEMVDRYRVSSGRHLQREKKLSLSILSVKDDVTLNPWFESLRM